MNKIFHPNIDELYVIIANQGSQGTDRHTVKEWLGVFGRHQPDLVTYVRCVCVLTSRATPWMNCGPDMINIFEVFLPQLLRYPNPNDPLNGEAAALMMRHPKEYEAKVKGK